MQKYIATKTLLVHKYLKELFQLLITFARFMRV